MGCGGRVGGGVEWPGRLIIVAGRGGGDGSPRLLEQKKDLLKKSRNYVFASISDLNE